MISPHAATRSLIFVLFLCGACGGNKPAPLTADTPSSDPPESSPPSADADAGAPSDAPSIVACVSGDSVCAETSVSGAEASDAADRCKGAKGEPHDGECSHDNIAATCAVDSKKLTLYYYKAANAKTTRGLLKSGASSCQTLGGTFTLTKPAGGGGKKKKPAKTK